MRLGVWLRSGEVIGWLAAGTIRNLCIDCPSPIVLLACALCLKKNQNAPRLSEHPPVRGGEMSKRLGGIKRLQIIQLHDI